MEYDIDIFHFCGVVVIIVVLFFQGIAKLWQWIRGQLTPAGNVGPAKKSGGYLGIIVTIGALVFVIVLSALSDSSSTPTLTRTPRATTTITTSKPLTPRPTKTPRHVRLQACVTNSTVRIRKGPGTDYEQIGGMASGTCMSIQGRNTDASWVYMVSEDGKAGWVAASLLTIDGNLHRVSAMSVASSNLVVATKEVPTSTRQTLTFATNTPRPVVVQSTANNANCSPAYPGVCIPPRPPDLDCSDIPYNWFTVLPSDPHGFDRDGDGIGCES
jgi:uncharacterized protein YraI